MTHRNTAPRPRIIERWFPCAEVSAASSKGWGSSNSEILIMSWFAKRPLAQSRAAVLCSLLPWPEEHAEQERIKGVIREGLNSCQDPDWSPNLGRAHAHDIEDCARYDKTDGYDAARRDILRLIAEHYPNGAQMLDPFSGRGLIPVEAARYGIQANAIDYSPVATLASRLLIDWPLRNWNDEPLLPFKGYNPSPWQLAKTPRLVHDLEFVQNLVGERWAVRVDKYFPDDSKGQKPWGYLWASIIPCNECGREFPLYASNELRKPVKKQHDPGQSFELQTDGDTWNVTVVSGITTQPATMHARPGTTGKLAWCPFRNCGHPHEKKEHQALSVRNFDHVAMLVVSDLEGTNKVFRVPTEAEHEAAELASADLLAADGVNGLPLKPDERIGRCNRHHIPASAYGAQTFGDLCVDRQNLAHGHLAATIVVVGDGLRAAGLSDDYVQALTGYCGAVLARKLKRSTRGSRLQTAGGAQAGNAYENEGSLSFSYDSFEVGLGHGPGSWQSVGGIPRAVARLAETAGTPGKVQRGSALTLPFADGALDAIVTDPPYDMMIDYTDASDLWFVWLKRALGAYHPDFAMTMDPFGGQEKSEEIIVKDNYTADPDEHRTPAWYDAKITDAFVEHCRAVHNDGVVTIVFGHNEPDVWRRLLGAIASAGLVLTGAWPANTEKGGQPGSANINTTLTLACRPSPGERPDGGVSQVDAEVRTLVKERVREVWTPSQLSYVDQKMAAVGPALEVVGRYARVLDNRGREVELDRYLPLARQAVTDAWDMRFDGNPLEVFDRRTQFALEWVRATGRAVSAASEARWQRLAADMEDEETEGLLADSRKPKGVRFIYASEWKRRIEIDSPFVDVALGAAKAWQDGSLAHAAAVIRASGYEPLEPRLWAVIEGLSKDLPEADRDGAVWAEMLRNKSGIVGAVHSAEAAEKAAAAEDAKPKATAGRLFEPSTNGDGQLFADPNSLFGREGN
jgi:putative DNA methylase